MRLIDAEKCPCLVKCYSNTSEVRCCFEPCDELKKWFFTSAYDVDKVCDELENAEYPYWVFDVDNYVIEESLLKAGMVEDIVRQCGIE